MKLWSAVLCPFKPYSARSYHVLAIETSCDDTAVALIERVPGISPGLIDHEKVSLDNSRAGGIIPTDAQVHHMRELPPLVDKLLNRNSLESADLICSTRGPGMFGCLSAGFNFGKGLSLAWKKPFVGVHHMLGHLLTPRYFTNGENPQFPFLSLLVSGGHTMLVQSRSLTEHQVLIDTLDIAVGDALDKCARELGMRGNMLGFELEKFCHGQNSGLSPDSKVPADLEFPIPLHNSGKQYSNIAFSFACYLAALKRAETAHFPGGLASLSDYDRQELGKRLQIALFAHITTQIKKVLKVEKFGRPIHLVCSGGVASNQLLRSMLSEQLPDKVELYFVDPKWCTDNALMIGWTGIELYEAGLTTRLDSIPRSRWPLSELVEEGYWIMS